MTRASREEPISLEPRRLQVSAARAASFIMLAMIITPIGSSLAADGPDPIAHVVDVSEACSSSFAIRDPSAVSSVQRDSHPGCSIGYFTELHAGDQIIISSPKDWLHLRFRDGRTIRLATENSPYDVQNSQNAATLISGFLNDLFDMLRPAVNDTSAISAVSRGRLGGPLEVPLFDSSSPLTLAAGERSFAFEWNGGVPPFRVELTRHGQVEPIGDWRDIDEQGLKPQRLNLSPGQYGITIRDSKNIRETSDLIIVDAAALPSLPNEFSLVLGDGSVDTFVAAAWLASRDDRWRLESYLLAQGVAEQYLPAKVLADRLADGRPIPRADP